MILLWLLAIIAFTILSGIVIYVGFNLLCLLLVKTAELFNL